jgi:hypothetical protein
VSVTPELGRGYLVGRIRWNAHQCPDAARRWPGITRWRPSISETERQLYPACEQAAKAEKRGLWQEKEPLSPWQYRKQEELKELEALSANHAAATAAPKMDGLALARKAGAAAFTGPPMPAATLLRSAQRR